VTGADSRVSVAGPRDRTGTPEKRSPLADDPQAARLRQLGSLLRWPGVIAARELN